MMLELLGLAGALAPFAFMGIVDPCSQDELVSDAACLNLLSPQEKLAARVYFMCQQAAACGAIGTCDLDQTAIDAACFKFPPALRDSIMVALECEAASNAGASVDCDDVNALREAIKCLKLHDPELLHAMEIYLKCKLNSCIT